MKFVLCSEQTYKELYQPEAYKWIKIQEHGDLVGFPSVHVFIHDCWMYEINDDRVDYLEQQLTALADFGYIKITYKDSEGWEENYEMEAILPVATPQQELLKTENTDAVISVEVEDSGCDSGACAI